MGRLVRARVLVADDHPLYRDGITRAIKERPDLELVGAAGDGREALELIRELRPDVAVVDLEMPRLDGLAVAAELATAVPSCAVVILTGHGRPPTCSALVRPAPR